MSNDDKLKNKDYGDSSQLTNWILDSGATCHMMPEVTDFIPVSLEDTDKFIGSEDHMIAKFPKPPKDNEKRRKSEKSKEKGTRACDNSDDDNELKL